MEKSYDEILRLLDFLGIAAAAWPTAAPATMSARRASPQDSPAVRDMIRRALASPDDDPLYVVAIGAITNVASAMLLEPEIVKKIVVIWLGGHNLNMPHAREFNLKQMCRRRRLCWAAARPWCSCPATASPRTC